MTHIGRLYTMEVLQENKILADTHFNTWSKPHMYRTR